MPLGPNNLYSDIDLDFTKHPITNDIPVKTDLESVKRSLRNLLLYNRFEKPFQPNIFTGINSLLFENNSPVYVAIVKNKIVDIIRRYEPRVDELKVEINPDEDQYGLRIGITFSVRSFPEVQEVSFILERLR